MIILRAGLVGCLAAIMNPSARIMDDRLRENVKGHKAVMRFRSDAISKATGIPFKKITVRKALFSSDGFIPWNPEAANKYSLQVAGGIFNRSINNLDPVERWLAPDNFYEQLLDKLGDRVLWDRQFDNCMDYDGDFPVISTIPMNEMLTIVGENECDLDMEENTSPIYISTLKVPNCDVHQTIYYALGEGVYRATLEGDKLIIESNKKIEHTERMFIATTFGIKAGEILMGEYTDDHVQAYGKIKPMDNNKRLNTILMLTEKYNIYSLGRTATHRSILMDDSYNDIKVIQKMLNTPKYQRAIGK